MTTTTEHLLAAKAELAAMLLNAPLMLHRAYADTMLADPAAWLARLGSQVRCETGEPGLPCADDVELTPDGIAIVRARGLLVRRRNLPLWYSGYVSYEGVAELVASVAKSARVRGLVLALDSPGGTHAGTAECAEALADATRELPYYVVADGQMASAAYYVGCGADRIFGTATSAIGAIGAYLIRVDVTKLDAEIGITYTVVQSDERKTDGFVHKEPSTDELDDMQRWVDAAAGMFREEVAAHRSLTVDDIRELKGATFMAADAVTKKLADKVGGVPEAVAALTKKITDARSVSFGTPTRTERTGGMDPKETGKDKADEKVAALFGDPAVQERLQTERQEGVAAGTTAAKSEAEEIALLCLHYGAPERTAEFLKAGKTRAEVFAIFQDVVVKKEQATRTSGANGGGDPTPVATQLEEPEVVQARRRKEAMAHRYGQGVA